MNLDALWHYLECGRYAEDLLLWRALVATTGRRVGTDFRASAIRHSPYPAAAVRGQL